MYIVLGTSAFLFQAVLKVDDIESLSGLDIVRSGNVHLIIIKCWLVKGGARVPAGPLL